MIGITLLLLKLAKTIGRSRTLAEDYSAEVAAQVSSRTFSRVRSINTFCYQIIWRTNMEVAKVGTR